MKQNDITILAMMVNLVLGLFFDVVFYTYNAIEKVKDTEWKTAHYGLGQILNEMPVTFLSIAIVINTRNWNYYYLKIKEAAFINHLSTEFETPVAEKRQEDTVQKCQDRTKMHVFWLNIFTVAVILIHQAMVGYLVYYSIANPDQPTSRGSYLFTGVTYLLLAAYFSITSFNIIR